LAKREGVSPSYFTRLVRLSYLAPDITQAILDGRQPRDLTADKLLAHSRLPLAWHEQRAVLGFARSQSEFNKPPPHRRCGTGIWPDRDIPARRRHVTAPCPSLPTAPLDRPAHPREKPASRRATAKSPRDADSPLEGAGFEPSVPREAAASS
jgi:hypothetical protein